MTLNGHQIAGTDEVIGMFRRFEFDINEWTRIGENNVLAVETISQGKLPDKLYQTKQIEATTGWDDHNPQPPDMNMGIWENVYIPTRELVRLKAYQSRVIQIQYASPVSWAPDVEDEMVNGVIEMVRSNDRGVGGSSVMALSKDLNPSKFIIQWVLDRRERSCASSLYSLLMFVLIEAFAELKAGAAKADITPPIGSRMYGYGAPGTNVSKGVHDRLYAKALILDDGTTKLAIATLDLGSFTHENTTNAKEIVRKRMGIENVLCIASDPHSAPWATLDFPSKENPWIREAERKIAGAIVEATGNLSPAKIGTGWGEVREGHNRCMIDVSGKMVMFWANRECIPTSPVDYQLAVIRVEGLDGKPIATLVNFACHPVVLGPENLLISADYPGVFTRLVEERIGGQCMFLQGAAGDINPFWDKTRPAESAYKQMEKMGTAIADETVKVSRQIADFKTDPKVSFHAEVIPLATRRDVERKNRDLNAEINTVLIGDDLALATFPSEFFVGHGLSLKEHSRFKHTVFVGYCNDALAYFPTIQACTEGGSGAASATRVEVGAGEKLVNRALINLYYQAGMISP